MLRPEHVHVRVGRTSAPEVLFEFLGSSFKLSRSVLSDAEHILIRCTGLNRIEPRCFRQWWDSFIRFASKDEV
jgi:hypothetical protein